MENNSAKPGTANESTISALSRAQEVATSPELMAKRGRLLSALSSGSSAPSQTASNSGGTGSPPSALPDAPKRADFASKAEFEEAMGGWHSRVGRIKAMVALNSSKGSRPPSK